MASLPLWPEGVRCETCRHWRPDNRDESELMLCRIGESLGRSPMNPTTAWADPDDKWWGYLVTLPEHACNQWQEKS